MIGETSALISKVQTMSDGGIRLVLDLTAQDAALAALLMARHVNGQSLVRVRFEDEQAKDIPMVKKNELSSFDLAE